MHFNNGVLQKNKVLYVLYLFFQDHIDSSNPKYISQASPQERYSRYDQYHSADNLRNPLSPGTSGVKRSSSFVNVTTGRISRGPSSVTRNQSDTRVSKSQHRSASVEVSSRRHRSKKKSQDSSKDKVHDKRNTQRNLMPQYQQNGQVLNSNQDIAYASDDRNLQSNSRQTSNKSYIQASQIQTDVPMFPHQLSESQDLNQSTNSGKYDVEKMHQSGTTTNQSSMPISEMQADSDTSSSSEEEIKLVKQSQGQTNQSQSVESSHRKEYVVQQSQSDTTRYVQSSVQSIPELSDTSSSNSNLGIDETVTVSKVERKDGVNIVKTVSSPPAPPPPVQNSVSYSTKTEVSTSKTTSDQKMSLQEELRKKISASKEASKTGVNQQVVGNGTQYQVSSTTSTSGVVMREKSARQDTSSENRTSVTSLRQVYAAKKSPFNSRVNSREETGLKLSSDYSEIKTDDNANASMSQTVLTTREVNPSGIETVTMTREVKPSGTETVTTTKEVTPSGTETVTTMKEVTLSGTETVTTTKEVKSSSIESTTKDVQPSGIQTVSTKTITTEIKPSADQTTTTSSEKTTVVTSTTSKSESTQSQTHQVQMRKKSETTMQYERDVRDSIRQLDDFLKTQDGDNVSLSSQGSGYVMGEPLSVGPPNLESWHF